MKFIKSKLISKEDRGEYSIKRLFDLKNAGFYETTIPAMQTVPNHYHVNCEEVLYFRGSGQIQVEGVHYDVVAGDFISLEKGEEHTIYAGTKDLKLIAIKFPNLKEDKVITSEFNWILSMFQKSPQFLAFTHGLTGTGKSTLTRYLEKHVENLTIIHTAKTRLAMGLALDDINDYEFNLKDIEFQDVSYLIYKRMLEKAEIELNMGNSVILDGSFHSFWQREKVYNFMESRDFTYYTIHVQTPTEKAKQRIEARRNLTDMFSEASDWETYLSLKNDGDDIRRDYMRLKALRNLDDRITGLSVYK